MSVWAAVGIMIGVAAAGVLLMMLVRRRTHAGGLFRDFGLAAGVYAVVGTTYAVLLAFTFLLAFQSFADARDNAELEAVATADLFQLAASFPPPARERLQGQLACYSRSVVELEWPAMREGNPSAVTQAWIGAIARTYRDTRVRDPRAVAAFTNWYFANNQREEARRGRLLVARPLVPGFLWFILLVGGAVMVVFVLFLADVRERRRSQAWLMVGTVVMIVSGLLAVRYFDTPFRGGASAITTDAMVETLELMRQEGEGARPPCDARGTPRGG